MSRLWIPLCVWCKHFHDDSVIEEMKTCEAFPISIPEDILQGYFDHRNPHPADHGIQFEEQTDAKALPYPLSSMPLENLTRLKRLVYELMEEKIKLGKPPKRKDGEDIV